MRVLIIGNLGGQLAAASRIAHARGAKVRNAPDIESALNSLRSGQGAEVVLCDIKQSIKQLVDSLKNERINVPVIACGLDATSVEAANSIRAGAKEYLPLPPDEEMIAAVLEAITEDSHDVIYASPNMRDAISMAEQVAASDASVLITGESGTGKEVISRHIHKKSKRADKPYISINCAAIPDNLLESELFGYEKGAFTGAVARRLGKFEEADGGTLLLDEISEMDSRLQAKLLRAVQEREIDRIGGGAPVKINIRILATSNRDLEEEVAKGTFRQDLYFRLNVINIQLPPLRERVQDIEPLATFFARKYEKLNGLPQKEIAADAMAKLQNHNWPGNVRELENTMHRAVILAGGSQISADAILLSGKSKQLNQEAEMAKPGVANYDTTNPLVGRTLESVERDLILNTLDKCLGNRTHAAGILGISIRTLRNKLKQYTTEGFKVPPAPAGEGEADAA